MIRALTVQQPWAWAIIHGQKTVENRTQLFTYRGPLLIHAGRVWSPDGAASPLVQSAWEKNPDVLAGGLSLSPWHFQRGAIIGVVELVDVHHAAGCCAPWGEHGYTHRGDGGPGRRITHLVLENPRPLAPIRCQGHLGIWTPTPYILDQIEVPA